MRDERYFRDPEEFKPTRYLNADKDGATGELLYDPGKLVFGFGRRFVFHLKILAQYCLTPNSICPGRYFADDLVWFAITSVLSVFDILPAIDPTTGEPLPPRVEFNSSVIRFSIQLSGNMSYSQTSSYSTALPYRCRVVPRNETCRNFIRNITDSDVE